MFHKYQLIRGFAVYCRNILQTKLKTHFNDTKLPTPPIGQTSIIVVRNEFRNIGRDKSYTEKLDDGKNRKDNDEFRIVSAYIRDVVSENDGDPVFNFICIFEALQFNRTSEIKLANKLSTLSIIQYEFQ